MKKTIGAMLFLLCATSLPADESLPRVYLQTPLHDDANTRLSTIANTVYDTAGLILSMLGQYDLVLGGGGGIDDPAAFCEENDLDRLITGNCSASDDGGYDISLSVYDRGTGGIVAGREERAETALHVFDAVDNLVIPLLEELSGREIAFGTLSLKNRGAEGRYRFFLDGVEYPPEEEVLDRILFGSHTVRIEQDRMEGRYVVDHETVEILEDGITSFSFTVPGILGREERELSVLEDAIERNWRNPFKRKTVDNAFDRLLLLLEDVSYSSDMAARKASVLKSLEEWEAYKYERKHGNPGEDRDGRLILSFGMDVLGIGGYDPDSYKSYGGGDPIDFHASGYFLLPKIGMQYFLTDHHALLARFAVLGGEGELTPETVANSEGEASVLGNAEGGFELTLGYEYYFKRLFVGMNAEARAVGLKWDTASDSGGLEPPDGQNLFGFSLEPKVGILLNQRGDFVYKFFLSIGSAFYSVKDEGTYLQPLDSIRIGFSAGYGGFRF